ncbi:MAG TPA: hypothetical protein VNZ53_29790 [Steroidobacteraceae bacterium]|jgi:hypothetical protein|nr:hypothetical protein [Steroidobacteraceae bacterium]
MKSVLFAAGLSAVLEDRTMKSVLFAAGIIGLIIGGHALPTAYADDGKQQLTIFTPRLSGDHFVCSAVNVSQRPLTIGFKLLDVDGHLLVPLAGSDANPTPNSIVQPGTEAEIDLRFNSGIPPTDGYCEVIVAGARERNDVRVDLQVYWTKPIIPGTTTPIIQLARTVQGY